MIFSIVEEMATGLKLFFSGVKWIFFVFWGVHFVDWLPRSLRYQIEHFASWEQGIQTIFALIGGIFFLIKLPFIVMKYIQDRKTAQVEKQIKDQELIKLKRENEATTS